MILSYQFRQLPLAVALAALFAFALAPLHVARAQTTTNVSCDVPALVTAMNDANASAGDDILELASGCTYTLTATHNGNNGLPQIVDAASGGTLTINGNGATITRDAAAPQFRIFWVASGGDLTLDNIRITGGDSPNDGGGMVNNGGAVTLTNSTLSGNTTSGYGGGIFNVGGALMVSGSAIVDNQAGSEGGGISNYNNGTLTITNSTFSGNSAEVGGGIVSSEGGTTTITYSTFAGNTAVISGGGLENYYSMVILGGSIVAGNTAPSGTDIFGTVDSNDYNLIEATSGATITGETSNNLTGVTSMLGALADNGGLTQTLSLQPGSPAINAGGACGLTTDQRGEPRGSLCDIGAYEVPYTIMAAGWGPGDGTMSATGIDCASSVGVTSGDCWDGGNTGAVFEITAAASVGSTFAGWMGCNSTSGLGNSVCTVTLGTSDVTVTARFKADTTTTITSIFPNPSAVGSPVIVGFTVTSDAPGTPTGNVTVSDGTNSCTNTVAAGSCVLMFTSTGEKTLTATYTGNSSFNGSVSEVIVCMVNKANTTTKITGDAPALLPVGQPVVVSFSVVVNAPGNGIPTGDVLVSDGVDTCVGTVAVGSCVITFTNAGERTLTATYMGDANFNESVSAGKMRHVLGLLAITEQVLFAQMQQEIAGNPAITGIDLALADFVPGVLNLVVRTVYGTVGDVNVSVTSGDDYVIMTITSITVDGTTPPQSYTDIVHRELMPLLIGSFDALLTQTLDGGTFDVFDMTVDDTFITMIFFQWGA